MTSPDFRTLDPFDVAPSPFQPRSPGRAMDFERLRRSVVATGRRDISTVQVEELTGPVEYEGRTCSYRLLDGESRWREACAARQTDPEVRIVAHIINGLSDQQRARIALFANVHKKMLPIEQARGVQQLIELELGGEAATAGRRLGRQAVAATTGRVLAEIGLSRDDWKRLKRLLLLPPQLQERLLAAGLPRQSQLAFSRLDPGLADHLLSAMQLADSPKYTAEAVRVAGQAAAILAGQRLEPVHQLRGPAEVAVLLRYAAGAILLVQSSSGEAAQVAADDYRAYMKALWHGRHRPDDEPGSNAAAEPGPAAAASRSQVQPDRDDVEGRVDPSAEQGRQPGVQAAAAEDNNADDDDDDDDADGRGGDKSSGSGIATEVAAMREQLLLRRRELAALDGAGRRALRRELAGVALLVESMIAECG